MLEIVAIVLGFVSVVLLMPNFFNASAPDGGGMNESLTGELGRVVPAGENSTHPFWVEVRGERWRASCKEPRPREGARVEVIKIDGLVAEVRPVVAKSSVSKGKSKQDPGGMRSLRWGLASWAAACGVCWVAVGSPLYAFLGVPGALILILSSLANFEGG